MKGNRNKWILAILAATIALCLAACTGTADRYVNVDPDENTEETQTEEEIDVVREDHYGYTVNRDETYAFYSYDGKNVDLVIPETSESGVRVTAIASGAFKDVTTLATVTIPSSVTEVGEYAFDGCTATVRFADPAIVTLTKYAFAGYRGSGLIVPDSVTTIEPYAFSGATAEILWGDPAVTTLKKNTFAGYAGKNLTVPSSVTTMEEGALAGCTALTRVTLPFVGRTATETSASPRTEFGYAFGSEKYEGASAVSQRHAENATYTAYYLPDTLRSVTVTGGTLFYGAFYNCSVLRDVRLSVDAIGDYAFFNCFGLEDVTVTAVGSYGISAFDRCTSLVAVRTEDFGAWCSAEFMNNYSNPLAYAHVLYVSGEKLTNAVIPDVDRIGDHAFYGCTTLEEATIPASVETIGAYAFYGCEKLVRIRNYSKAHIASPARIGGEVAAGDDAFTTTLTTDSAGVKTFTANGKEYLFGYEGAEATLDLSGYVSLCGVYPYALDSLTLMELTLPRNLESVGEHAFDACKKLVHVRVLSGQNVTVTTGATLGAEILYGTEEEYENTLTTRADGVVTYQIKSEIYLMGYVGQATTLLFGDYGKTSTSAPTDEPTESTEPTEPTPGEGEGESGEGTEEPTEPTEPTEPEPTEPEPTEPEPTVTPGEDEDEDAVILTAIYAYAFYGNETLQRVAIPNAVKTVGDRAFGNCYALRQATIPESVTTLGEDVFVGCHKLVRIVNESTKASVSSPAFIGGEVAAKESLLTGEILDTSGVLTYEVGGRTYLYGYEGKSSQLKLSRYSFITAIYPYALYGNLSLQEVSIPVSVKEIGENALLKTAKAVRVTDMTATPIRSQAAVGGEVIGEGEKFANALRKDESDVWTYYADNKVYLFGYTGTNGTLDLSRNTSITDVYPYAFAGNTTLTFVVLPSGVTVLPEGVFSGCVNLTGVTLPAALQRIEANAFAGCEQLSVVTVKDLESWCGLAFNGFASNPMTYAKTLASQSETLSGTVVLPEELRAIPDYTFRNNTELLSVTVGANVTSIGAYAFSDCTSLRSVTITGAGLTDIRSYAFKGCTRMSSFRMGDGAQNVWSYAFFGCKELADVTVSATLKHLGTGAFAECAALRQIHLPAGLLTVGADAFLNCPLSAMTLPTVAIEAVPKTRLERVEITSGDIPYEAFRGCTTLSEVVVGNGVDSIGGAAFMNCSSLTSLSISPSVTSVGSNAFYGCPVSRVSAPTSVMSSIPKGELLTVELTGGRNIADAQFSNCTKMTSVTIAKSVTTIGRLAFGGCTALSHIYFTGTRQEWNNVDKYVTSDGAESWDFGTSTYTVHCSDQTFVKETR